MHSSSTCWTWPRIWLALFAIFVAGLFLAGPQRFFPLFGMKPSVPDYADARVITAAFESLADGHDPLLENPRDPFGRALNYPRIWLLPAAWGLNQSHTAMLAHLLMASYFLGWLIFPPANCGMRTAAFMPAIGLSPAAILCIERGNIDLLIFFMLAVVIRCSISPVRWLWHSGWVILFSAFILKLYPLAGLPVFASSRPRRLIIPGLIFGLMAALYLGATWGDIALISHNTPRPTGLSSGRNVLWMELLDHSLPLAAIGRFCSWAGVAAAAGLVVAGWIRGGNGHVETMPSVTRSSFLMGAGIYGGTFLLGNNWDYRLVFLLFTIPLLSQQLSHKKRLDQSVAAVALTAATISCWYIIIFRFASMFPYGGPSSVLFDEFANWVLFLCLAFLAGAVLKSVTLANVPES